MIPFVEASIYAALGFLAGVYAGRKSKHIPFRRRKAMWTIGIFTGDSPFSLLQPEDIKNPVLTAADVKDTTAEFIADPFMVFEKNVWHMFFEVMNRDSKKGEIGLATSNNCKSWNYERIVLTEPFHLSYPYVFKWQDHYYMIPETGEAKSVRLYRAEDFPYRWVLQDVLLDGHPFLDASVIQFEGKWWLFTSLPRNNILLLYYAESLTGPWTKHPESPVIMGDPAIARPGGRPIIYRGKLNRFTQDTNLRYGNKVRAFEITELTTEKYREREIAQNPVVGATGSGWNSLGMHTVDPHEIGDNNWIACVDGEGIYTSFGLRP